MALKFDELRVLQIAETVADRVWHQVVGWKPFARDTVGKQLAEAADSIGANIAEAYGRFHYSEKLQFLYYARGSLFESKYWLNRASERNLMPSAQAQEYAVQLTDLVRQLNTFAADLKAQRQSSHSPAKAIREPAAEYVTGNTEGTFLPLFTQEEIEWFQTTNL